MLRRAGLQALPRSSKTKGASNSRPPPRPANYPSRGQESYKGGELGAKRNGGGVRRTICNAQMRGEPPPPASRLRRSAPSPRKRGEGTERGARAGAGQEARNAARLRPPLRRLVRFTLRQDW